MPGYRYRADGQTDAVTENINELDVRESAICESRLAHLKELAHELFRLSEPDGKEASSTLQRLQNIKRAYDLVRDGELEVCLADNKNSVARFFDRIDNTELVELSKAIKELILSHDNNSSILQFFSEYNETVPPTALDKVACIKNIYTDTAYSRFALSLKNPSVLYYDSFSALCEEVSALRCEYCILPIENSDDGKLMSFYKLLSMHELNIVLTTSVSFSDDSKSTSFALLKKGMENVKRHGTSPVGKYFEFSFIPDENVKVFDICEAAELLGMRLHRIDCSTLAYSESEFEYYIVLNTDNADLFAFLIYMTIKVPHYNSVGLYTKIK